MKSVSSYIKHINRTQVISAVILVALLAAGWFFFFRGAAGTDGLLVLELKPFIQQVSVSGKVIAAKEQITSAFIGVTILLASWLILNTISDRFIKFEMTELGPIDQKIFSQVAVFPLITVKSVIETEIPFGKIIEDHVLESKYIRDERMKNGDYKNQDSCVDNCQYQHK